MTTIPVPEVPAAQRDRNERIRKSHADRCLICRRPVDPSKSKSVHLVRGGGSLSDSTDYNGPDNAGWDESADMGYFQVGPECAKRVPRGYLFDRSGAS